MEVKDPVVELQLLVRNKRIRDARKEKGFTQKDLSLMIGIRIDTIVQIENLRFIPSQEIMEEIASALEKPVDFLFPRELLDAIEEGVFQERKAQLKAQQIITLTEAKRLGYQPVLVTSGEEVEEGAEADLLKDQVKEVLDTLNDREKKILTLRFGLNEGGERTLMEVGREFDLNKERIRQLEDKALRKLRHPARSRNLKDFV